MQNYIFISEPLCAKIRINYIISEPLKIVHRKVFFGAFKCQLKILHLSDTHNRHRNLGKMQPILVS